jgi:hypothetical protein
MFHIGYIGYVDVASLYQDREISNGIIPSPTFMKSGGTATQNAARI